MRWLLFTVMCVAGCSLFVGDDGGGDPGGTSPGCPPSPNAADDAFVEFCFDTPEVAPPFIDSSGGVPTQMFFDFEEPIEVDDAGLVLPPAPDNGANFALSSVIAKCQAEGAGVTFEVVLSQNPDQTTILGTPRRIFDMGLDMVGGFILGVDLLTDNLVLRTPRVCECANFSCEVVSGRPLVAGEPSHVAVSLAPDQQPALVVNGVAVALMDQTCAFSEWPTIAGPLELVVGKSSGWSAADTSEQFRRFWSGTIQYIAVSCGAMDAGEIQSRSVAALGE